jgi:hypothetical protein
MKVLPDDYWDDIEKYLPNYSSSGEVLQSDILTRYIDDEEISDEDLKWINEDLNIKTKYRAKAMLFKIDKKLYFDALRIKSSIYLSSLKTKNNV